MSTSKRIDVYNILLSYIKDVLTKLSLEEK